MSRVLAVFVDALKPESLGHMEFLGGLESRRLKTTLGYSNTCHATMYTGVHPNRHGSWFIWKYHPDNSPYRVLRGIGRHKWLNDTRLKLMSYMLLQFFNKNERRSQIAGGFPLLVRQPMSNWAYFDAGMVGFSSEPGDAIGGYPTIFKLLRDNNVAVRYYFCDTLSRIGEVLSSIESTYPGEENRFDFVFIGEVDTLSHKYGQASPETVRELKALDRSLGQGCRKLAEKDADFSFVLWSDHGHIRVEESVDLYELFANGGRNLTDYIHFVDSSFARFWFRSDTERSEVEGILSGLGDKGFILSEGFLKKYHLDMPDSDYGELIFYLDRPYIFASGKLKIFGRDRTSQVVSHHSFLPDYPDMDGVFITNQTPGKAADKMVRLEDISPSILGLFGAGIPKHIDGEAVWKA